MIEFKLCHPKATFQMLGFLPEFWDERDPRPAKEQANENYVAGWHPFTGFKMEAGGLKYPGDPLMHLLAEARLRDETIKVYEHAWVAIVQKDGSFETCRMD